MNEPQSLSSSVRAHRRLLLYVLGGVLALVAAGIATIIIFLGRQAGNNDAEVAMTAEQIQQQMRQSPPGENQTPPAAAVPQQPAQPGGSPAAPEPAGPAITHYQNLQYGFGLELPSDWQITDRPGQAAVALTAPDGQHITVQMFSGVPDTLMDIKAQLQGSPSVRAVADASLGGEPALMFDPANSGDMGFAAFHNGNLYYIYHTRGSAVAKTFKFK